MHQLAEAGGRVKGAEPQQAAGGRHRVRELLLHLLPAAATGIIQQRGGTVEPSTQTHRCCRR